LISWWASAVRQHPSLYKLQSLLAGVNNSGSRWWPKLRRSLQQHFNFCRWKLRRPCAMQRHRATRTPQDQDAGAETVIWPAGVCRANGNGFANNADRRPTWLVSWISRHRGSGCPQLWYFLGRLRGILTSMKTSDCANIQLPSFRLVASGESCCACCYSVLSCFRNCIRPRWQACISTGREAVAGQTLAVVRRDERPNGRRTCRHDRVAIMLSSGRCQKQSPSEGGDVAACGGVHHGRGGSCCRPRAGRHAWKGICTECRYFLWLWLDSKVPEVESRIQS
jgi:hypothetical protein